MKNNGYFEKGQIPWNKGKKDIYSKETLDLMSKAKLGKSSWNKGKTHTKEHIDNLSIAQKLRFENPEERKKQSVSHKGKKDSEETKKKKSKGNIGKVRSKEYCNNLSNRMKLIWKTPESRKRFVDALEKSEYLKVRCDIGQPEFIAKWNTLGFNFEMNYKIRIGDNLYWLDGYDKEKNMVLEYDGKSHNKQKDIIRQNNIIEYLKPKRFWRYNVKNKQIRSVLGVKE